MKDFADASRCLLNAARLLRASGERALAGDVRAVRFLMRTADAQALAAVELLKPHLPTLPPRRAA